MVAEADRVSAGDVEPAWNLLIIPVAGVIRRDIALVGRGNPNLSERTVRESAIGIAEDETLK